MNLSVVLTKLEEALARIGLPAGPDSLLNHRTLLGILAGTAGALLGWILTEPFSEDFGFWRDFAILSGVGFFICMLIMSMESLLTSGVRGLIKHLLSAVLYCLVIVIPTVLVVKLLLMPSAAPPPKQNKVFILDTSGSMKGKSLETLKLAMNTFSNVIEQKNATQYVPLASISFDTDARVMTEPTTNYATFRAGVGRLEAEGLTNMPAAFELAEALITKYHLDAPAASASKNAPYTPVEVYFVTDGMPMIRPLHLPITRDQAMAVIQEGREKTLAAVQFFKDRGIPVNTIGAGEEFEPEFLQQISQQTGGKFVAARNIADLVRILEGMGNQVTLTGSPSTGSVKTATSRLIGWAIVGMAIGLTAALLRRPSGAAIGGIIYMPDVSSRALTYAIVGGLIGGALGALVFILIQMVLGALGVTSGLLNRLVGFTILGACVGFAVNYALAAAGRFFLVPLMGPQEGLALVIDKSPCTVGSSEAADLTIRGDALIRPMSAAFTFAQKGTSGGGETVTRVAVREQENVRVNGMPTRQAELKQGDRLTIGETEFRFTSAGIQGVFQGRNKFAAAQ